MKKIGVILIAAMILISATVGGTINAFAAVANSWYLTEDFEKGTSSYTSSNANSVNYFRIKSIHSSVGCLAVGRTNSSTRLELYTATGADARNHTPDGAYSLRLRSVTSGTTSFFYLASTYFGGSPSTAPGGSAVVANGLTDDSGTYAFNGCRFYEQSFYVYLSSGANTNGLTFDTGINTMTGGEASANSTPSDLRLLVKSGKVFVNNVDKGITVATGSWHQIKYVFDFDNNKINIYFDGEKVCEYQPAEGTDLYKYRRLEVTAPYNTTFWLDDLVSDPHDGRALTPFFTDFYVDGARVQNTAAGSAKAVVKLYKDIPAEYVVLGARFDSDGRLVDVIKKTQDDADTVDLSLALDFGTIAATDKLMVTAWNNMEERTPLITESTLIPA